MLLVQPAVINFGIVSTSELPVTQEVNVERNMRDDADEPLLFLPASDTAFTAKPKKLSWNKWTLGVKLSADAPIGPLEGAVAVTSGKNQPKQIPILGEIVGDVFADPKEIYVDPLQSKVGTQQIVLQGESARVTDVQVLSKSPNLAAVVQTSVIGNKVTVRYDISKPTSPKYAKGHLLLRATLKTGTTQKILVPITFARR